MGVGAPAALSEIFPTSVRATGTSLVYNGAFTLFGGFAPMILTYLTQQSGSLFAPAWYVMAAAMVALIAIPLLRVGQTRERTVDHAVVLRPARDSGLGSCSYRSRR